jgi:hypothetical protein
MMLTGLAIHVAAAVFLALHVVESRRSLWWLAALFLLPLLASVFYFLGIFLPELRFERRVRQLVARGRAATPPRQAQSSFEEAPSLENRLRLAASLLEAGAVAEALAHYEACLNGPFGDDPEVRLGTARAWLQSGRAEEAEQLLLRMREEGRHRCPEQATLLLAQAASMAGPAAAAAHPSETRPVNSRRRRQTALAGR